MYEQKVEAVERLVPRVFALWCEWLLVSNPAFPYGLSEMMQFSD